MPFTVWSVYKVSSRLIPGYKLTLVLMTSSSFRHVNIGSVSFISLARTWRSLASPFPITLTTVAFDQSSLWWFGITTCIVSPRGLPSSFLQHSYTSWDRNAAWVRFRGTQSACFRIEAIFFSSISSITGDR